MRSICAALGPVLLFVGGCNADESRPAVDVSEDLDATVNDQQPSNDTESDVLTSADISRRPTSDVASPVIDAGTDADQAVTAADTGHSGCDAAGSSQTEHCEEVEWVKALKAVPLPNVWTPISAPGTSGYGKSCRPIANRCCVTACDCKFIRIGDCKFAAVNKAEPWTTWGEYHLHKGKCWNVSCATTTALSKDATLACLAGQCVASGPGTVNLH